MADHRQALVELLEPTIQGLGFELVDLEVHSGRRRGLLRVFIDSPDGVTLSDCESVSRQISSVLDVDDPLPGAYELEVSSPGMDRRLTKPEHFDRFAGAEVDVRLRRTLDDRRRIKGILKERDGETIVVHSEGTSFRLPLAEIHTARLVPDIKVPSKRKGS